MAAVTGLQVLTLLFGAVLVSASAAQANITAECGQNIILPCRAPNTTIRIVQWNRTDLGTDEYVFAYRGGTDVNGRQHPSFENRVDLKDRQMKGGDVSLILNNVTINDTGIYECRVLMEDTHLWMKSIVYLSVAPPPGPVGLIVGLSVFALLLLVAGFWIYRNSKGQSGSPQPPAGLQPA